MNTLTVSIGLLVLATLVAVALHGLWQSYRQRSAPPSRLQAQSPAAGGMGLSETPAAGQARSDPSDFTLGATEPVAANSAGTDQVSAAAARSGTAEPAVGLGAPLPAAVAADGNPVVFAVTGEGSVVGEPVAIQRAGHEAGERAEPRLANDMAVMDSGVGQGAGPPAAAAHAVADDFMIQTDAEGVADNAVAVGSATGTQGPSSHLNPTIVDPSASDPAGAAAPTPSVAPVLASAGLLSVRTDCIVELALPSPVPGQKLLQTVQTIRRFGSKPALFEGLLAPEVRPTPTGEPGEPVLLLTEEGEVSAADPQQDHWVPLRADVFYRSLRMGVLLANRHGALNAMEFADFSETASRLADHLGALVMIPDMTRTLEAARALDVECIKLDAQLGINVDSLSALSSAHLSRLGRDLGLTERGSNRFVRLGRNDAVLFSMAQADRPNRLTLLLDVPRAPVDQQPWSALLQCAHDAMTAIQGHLVDDSGRPLNSRNLDSLSAELAKRYAMLDQSGFKAGSPLALRVFN